MNRVIKFRAWSKTAKVMHPRWNVVGDEDGEYILMQFTGLLDKNGVEIYEGDIINIFKHFSDKNGRPEIEHHGVVEWGSHGFVIEDDGSAKWEEGTYGLGSPAYPFNLEVVGNKYENKG